VIVKNGSLVMDLTQTLNPSREIYFSHTLKEKIMSKNKHPENSLVGGGDGGETH